MTIRAGYNRYNNRLHAFLAAHSLRLSLHAFVLAVLVMTLPPAFAGLILDAGQDQRGVDKVASHSIHSMDPRRLPVFFVANRGQLDNRIRFFETGSQHASFFVSDGLYQTIMIPGDRGGRRRASVHLRLLDMAEDFEIAGEGLMAARANYYLAGSAPRVDVPVYRRLRYTSVYPGIDLLFHGRQDMLEYDFIVAPGADPERIHLDYAGARYVRLAPDGGLRIGVEGGEIVQRPPIVYQEIGGRRVAVAGHYRIDAATGSGYGFEIAAYDPRFALVIDPVIMSSTFLGGADDDVANSVAIDAAGNVYIAGATWSSNFPTLQALKASTEPNYTDAFVTKFDASGALVFSTYIGGSNQDQARAIAVDSSGSVYITGQTSSVDFPTSAQPYLAVGDPFFEDVFVTQLTPTGQLGYSTYLGGSSDDYGNGIVVDESTGQVAVYVTGETWSHNFPISNPLYTVLNTGNNGDAFVARIDPGLAGAASLVWSTYIGGSSRDAANGVATDAAGNVYITGLTESSDFPATAGSYPSSFVLGYSRVFVVRINRAGNSLDYAGCIGGTADDIGKALAVDAAGVVHVTGTTRSLDFPVVQPLYTVADTGDDQDAFLFRLDTNATGPAALSFSTYLGGGGPDEGNSVAIDSSGNTYVAGMTWSADFPVAGLLSPPLDAPNGDKDAFVVKIDASGSNLLYSLFLGGGNEDQARDIALDPSGDVYVVGQTRSPDFPTLSAYQAVLQNGNRSGFLSRLR